MANRVLWAIMVSLPLLVAEAQTIPTQQRVVVLPRGALTRIPSPDQKWALIFECPNDCAERRLWIERRKTHARRMVREFERSLSISWAPDSQSFFIDDGWGSDGSDSYVYDSHTLHARNLADTIVARDPRADRYLKAGHAYLQAKRWISSHELLVTLFGHFDEPPPRGFRRSFTLRYRVDLRGNVHKVFERSGEDPR